MRSISHVFVGLLCLMLVNCGEMGDKPLPGTWQMISGTYTTPSGQVIVDVDDRLCYKILGDDHFAVVEMYQSKPDSLFFAAVGRYSLKDTVYTETLEGCNVPADVGRTNIFRSEIDGDRWRIYMKRQDMELDETWKRIRKPY